MSCPLSVVVPAFQAEATLARCLQALVPELPPGGEVLVVDDGSTDATARIALEAGVRVLRHPDNRGTSAARNTGWRASRGAVVAFVDADMVVRAGALHRLLDVLAAAPELLGANGIVTLDPPDSDLVTDFVNASLVWQLSSHGERVASSFTAMCVLRREALEQMEGWDERWFSRYADDIWTRFILPPRSIAFVAEAQGDHLKRVSLRGMLKHRANVGYFFAHSIAANRARARADNLVLDLRYPLNTLAAAGTLLCLPLGPVAVLPAGLFVLANARFSAFALAARGPRVSLAAVPLSALEGYAFLAGLTKGVGVLARRRLSAESADGR